MPDRSPSHYNVGVQERQNPGTDLELATPWSMVNAAQPDSPFRPPGAVSGSFLQPEHLRPTVKHDEFTDLEIPVIDLAGCDILMDPTIIAQVRDACLNWGFFQIINHSIDEELVSRIQRQAHRFFNLPHSEKLKVAKPAWGKFAGYGHATVKKGDVRPWSEGFYFVDEASTAELAQKLWPEGTNSDFVDSYSEYNEKVRHLSGVLMRIIVAGLGVNPGHFEQYTRRNNNTGGLLRWNYYPACPEPTKTLGLTEHTDFNLLTVLHQGEIGGLQIQKDGKWIAVRPRAGALAVNVGDTLQVLTNAKYKSVPHRAVVNATKPRISLVYFYMPLPSVEIFPAPELVDEHNPPKYKPFIFETYTRMKQLQFLHTLDHFLNDGE